MLNSTDKEVISQVFGVTLQELSGAISSESESPLNLRLPGRVITQEEENNLKTTLTDAGIEIGYKKLAKAGGLDLAKGEKDPEIIIGKITGDITSTLEDKYKNMTPSEELVDLQGKLKESEAKNIKLNETYEAAKISLEESQTKFTGLQKDMRTKELNTSILSAFPDKLKQDRKDALLITNNAFEFEETDNGIISKRDGKTVLDAVGNPETLENVVKAFVEEKAWVKGSGMNGKDRNAVGSGLPKGMTDEAAMNYLKEAGKDPMSNEGSEMFVELTKQ